MNVSVDFSNVCASFALSPIAACMFGAGCGLTVMLCVTLWKCAKGAWKMIFHN